jgi:hypothetical protein
MEKDMRFDSDLLYLYQSIIDEEIEKEILAEIFKTEDKGAILKSLVAYYNEEKGQ